MGKRTCKRVGGRASNFVQCSAVQCHGPAAADTVSLGNHGRLRWKRDGKRVARRSWAVSCKTCLLVDDEGKGRG